MALYGHEYTEEEKKKIIDVASRKGVYLGALCENTFLLEDSSVVFASFMNNIDTVDDSVISGFYENNINCRFTDEQAKQVARKLIEEETDCSDYETIILRNPIVLEELIKHDANIVDRLFKKTVYDEDGKLLDEKKVIDYDLLKRNNYKFNMGTKNIFSFGIDYIISEIERDFNLINYPNIGDAMYAAIALWDGTNLGDKYMTRIYEICKENGYEVSKKTPQWMKYNPYLYVEGVKNGTYSSYGRKEIKLELVAEEFVDVCIEQNRPIIEYIDLIKQYPLQDLRRVLNNYYIPSDKVMKYIKEYLPVVEIAHKVDFSEEQEKEIAKMFMDNFTKYNVQLYNNKFVSYELYKKYGFIPEGLVSSFNDEMCREIADKYFNEKGNILTANSNQIERSNRYIVESSIENNPQTINFVDHELLSEVIYEQVEEMIKSGRYKITKDTPYVVIEDAILSELITLSKENLKILEMLDYTLIDARDNSILSTNHIEDIKAYMISAIKAGEYEVTKDTPVYIYKDNPEIFKTILDNTLEKGGYLHYSVANWCISNRPDLWENLKEKVRLQIENGEDVKDLPLALFFKNVNSERKFDLEYTESLIKINPNIFDNLDVEDSIFIDFKYFKDIIIREIDNGNYSLENALSSKIILYDEDTYMAAFRKNPQLIFNPDFEYKYHVFSEENTDEIVRYVEANYKVGEKLPQSLKRNFNVIKLMLKHDHNAIKEFNDFNSFYAAFNFLTAEKQRELEEKWANEKYSIDSTTSEIVKSIPVILKQVLNDNPSSMQYIKNREVLTVIANDIGFNKEVRHLANLCLSSQVFSQFEFNDDFSPESAKSNISRVIDGIRKDWRNIDNISPLLDRKTIGREKNTIIDIAIKNNYVLNEKTPEFLRSDKTLIMHSVKSNPDSIKHIASNSLLDINRFWELLRIVDNHKIENGVQILIDRVNIEWTGIEELDKEERHKYFKVIEERLTNGEYNFSENSNRHLLLIPEVRSLILNQDFSKIALLKNKLDFLSLEEQKAIYEIYKNSSEEIKLSDEIKNIMKKNSYYIMDYIRENITRIDEINLNGICFTEEFKKELFEKLASTDYIVSERTPSVIRNNEEFMINYFVRTGNYDVANPSEIRKLFDFDKVYEHPEILKIFDEFSNEIYNFNKYFNVFGKEETFELVKKYGGLFKTIDLYKIREKEKSGDKVTLEQIHDEIVNKFLEVAINLSEEEQYKYFNRLNLSAAVLKSRDIFSKNSKLFLQFLEQDNSLIIKYKGNDEEVIEKAIECGYEFTEKDLKENEMYCSSSLVMKSVINSGNLDLVKYYTGNDIHVIIEATNAGIFDNKSKEEIKEIISNNYIYSECKEVFERILTKENVDLLELYAGTAKSVFEKALENGYVVDSTNINKFLYIPVMFNAACRNDIYTHGYEIEGLDKEKLNSLVVEIMGEDSYREIFDTDEKMKLLFDLSRISNNKSGVNFLKTINADLINSIGLENWETLVKYSYNNPQMSDLINICSRTEENEEKSLEHYITFYKNVSPIFNDDSAIGINKFLKLAHLYNMNPNLCMEVNERINLGNGLSSTEKLSLNCITYGESLSEHELANLTFGDLENLIEKEREFYRERLDITNSKEADNIADIMKVRGIKSDVFRYLFGMSIDDIQDMLERDMNLSTLVTMNERAKKEGNEALVLKTEYMKIAFNIIEQLAYSTVSIDELTAFASKIYEQPIEKIAKIKSGFYNLPELVRSTYELEAQTELTNIDELKNNSEFTRDYTLQDGRKVKIIDLSKSRHTLYGHVLGTSIDNFFDMKKGKVSICLSAETDFHEAYYFDDISNIHLGFTRIPRGSYIGSAISNMGTDGYIEDNNYRMDDVKILFRQRSIRDLYEKDSYGSGHSEVLLYRENLIPSCIILTGDIPNRMELKTAKEIENKIKELTGEEIEIPFVKTQKSKNRVYNYSKATNHSTSIRGFEKEMNNLQTLRKNILEVGFGEELGKEMFYGFDKQSGQVYTVINDELYTIIELNESGKRKATTYEAAMNLQKVIHGEGSPNVLDVRRINFNGDELVAVKQRDARLMWNYDKETSRLAPRAKTMLLEEFLVDHLLCNYTSDENAFLLDTDNVVYGVEKENALKNIDDFINCNGEVYTGMSFLYFDSEEGNNIYRRLFEDYITDNNSTLNSKDFERFKESAKRIAELSDEQYMDYFSELLETIPNDRAEIAKRVILERKQTLLQESENFVNRLNSLRENERNLDVYKSAESIAFISDIHGNYEALNTLLQTCEEQGKKDIYILGDMIGAGPESNECVDLIREASEKLNIKCILGNHELYSLMGNRNFSDKPGFDSEDARRNRNNLSIENRRFIESLPKSRRLVIGGKKVELIHYPEKPSYKDSEEIYMPHYQPVDKSDTGITQDYLIYGHEHRTEYTTGDEVGSVGTIMNGTTQYMNLPSSGCVHGKNTSFVTLNITDDGRLEPEVVSVQYDKEKTIEEVIKRDTGHLHLFGEDYR